LFTIYLLAPTDDTVRYLTSTEIDCDMYDRYRDLD